MPSTVITRLELDLDQRSWAAGNAYWEQSEPWKAIKADAEQGGEPGDEPGAFVARGLGLLWRLRHGDVENMQAFVSTACSTG